MTESDAQLADRLASIDDRIAAAARQAGRSPEDITRIVVTKFHPASLVEELYGLGVRDVGENRVQEVLEKVVGVGDLSDLRWHFVGQLQTNKARAVRRVASVIHSLDRPKLADALDAEAEVPLDVLIQVNLTDDPGRGGVAPESLSALAEHAAGCLGLRVRGVMAVAPLGEEPAAAFERLAGHAHTVRRVFPDATWISAGMTGDFEAAIHAGATHLRIGTAITGPRPVRG
ncbi:MAG TPA: YggS family pyridoxal phosphate-dependent enzyme [Microbacterium sp.]|uniref:YggS family pyridoxal phosphate-dependent enzyme n=1 Tax=Microbacterium TaxID=33882 RepID=UPI000E985D85|nr:MULTISPECIES: YggS family pyridoxal phosphate-dependent enzyme [Microbacterium]MEC8763529.1 YggS family pyridoxal phosphate-dependent enzyme [Actinomycetota bacterium]HAM12672.1 YggS family pyridoxal phosphate-dependent enzyme [Microbacterium sp.]MCC4268162.1 YggS family pyridoxal phosphate-dependent enzyme [Microbacterium schleiferi]HBS08079.1 YggS family pyridoxal phosphate-dependent enzyme [Microbacterium sp.]HBU42663.1 YggS family pyridoxal phosphate-dependent enzyme [Microbacterium sp.